MLGTVLTIIASIALILGIISLVTPVPGGLFVISISLTALICVNSKAQSCVRYFRTKSKFTNKVVGLLQRKVGSRIHFIGDALQRTEPPENSSE